VVGGRAKGVFKPGNHGSTFGGNPLAMTAVVATLDAMKEEGLLANAGRVGALIGDGLRAALGGAKGITEIRGMGMMIGVEFEEPCGELVRAALDAGLVINVTVDKVVRIMPPLVMSEAEGREVVSRFVAVARAFLNERAAA
jgi:acetylornithine aminotransferase